jgi:hypothetical protein
VDEVNAGSSILRRQRHGDETAARRAVRVPFRAPGERDAVVRLDHGVGTGDAGGVVDDGAIYAAGRGSSVASWPIHRM